MQKTPMIADANAKRFLIAVGLVIACWSLEGQNLEIDRTLGDASGQGSFSSSQGADFQKPFRRTEAAGMPFVPSTKIQLSGQQAAGLETEAGETKAPTVPAIPSSIEAMFAPAVPKESPPLLQFGYDFFQRIPITPPFTSVGDDYVVGPGDVLVVYIWGDAVDIANISPMYELEVDRNGLCFFPPIGSFSAWGLDLRSVKAYLKSALAKKYKKFDISITLSQIRQFPVYVAGFVNSPGVVMTNAAESLLDVISQAGGVMKTGSLRNITMTRRGQDKVTLFDLYDVLMSGRSTDMQIREGDSIFVHDIGTVVGITGAVKRPCIYELKEEKTVSELLSLAGGLLPSAYGPSISIVRFDSEHRRMINGTPEGTDIAATVLLNGDLVRVDPVRDLLANRIDVEGEVKFPGSYSLDSMPTLRDLVSRVKLLPNTNLFYAQVWRTEKGGFTRNFTFQPRKVLDGSWDAPLEALDQITFFRFGDETADADFDSFPESMTMEGPVRYPGLYAWSEGMRLKEILGKEDLLLDTNLEYGEIRRREAGSTKETILTFAPGEIAAGNADFELRPLDRIRFFPKSIDIPIEVSGLVKESNIVQYYDGISLIDILRMVTLNGNAQDMKAYIYREKPPEVAPALTFAAGTLAQQPITTIPSQPPSPDRALSQAFPGQGSLFQSPKMAQSSEESSLALAQAPQTYQSAPRAPAVGYPSNAPSAQVQASTTPSSNQAGPTQSGQQSPLVPSVMAAPGVDETLSKDRFVVYLRDLLAHQDTLNFDLRPGDRIVFAATEENEKKPQIIVRGQVKNPGAQLFEKGMRLSDALRGAGGFTSEAFPRGVVLLRKSAAELQKQQLDRVADILSRTLSRNIDQAVQSALSPSDANIAQIARLQVEAQKAEVDSLRSQISDVLGRITVRMPQTLEELELSQDNLPLDDGDSIFIPRVPTFVQIMGEVFNPITVAYHDGLRVKDYLSLVGGVTETGDPSGTYLIRVDGTVVSPKQKHKILWCTPTIEQDIVNAGDTIVVPKKEVSPKYILPVSRDIAQILASLATAAFSVYAITK